MKIIEIRANGTKRVYTKNEEPSKTDKSWKKDCDVNEIVRRFNKTGQITHLRNTQGVYADVSEITDLKTALETVQNAQNAFDSLPAELRKKFDNDPQKMIEYLQDPKNNDEAYKLGLKSRPPMSDEMDGPIEKSAVKAKPPKKDKNEQSIKNDSSADD